MKKIKLLVILSLILFTSAFAAEKRSFVINSGEVVFVSKAPLETFEGKTSNISGKFSFDSSDLGSGADGKIAVEVKTLTTGNKTRDGHMFDNHLHPDDYPEITLDITGINNFSKKTLVPGEEISLTIKGNFTLHGVTKEIESTGKARLDDENILNADFNFSVLQTDFEIKRPSFLVMKVADEIKINVKFTAFVQ